MIHPAEWRWRCLAVTGAACYRSDAACRFCGKLGKGRDTRRMQDGKHKVLLNNIKLGKQVNLIFVLVIFVNW